MNIMNKKKVQASAEAAALTELLSLTLNFFVFNFISFQFERHSKVIFSHYIITQVY